MIKDAIETLYQELPGLFQITPLAPDWHEDLIFVPIPDVEKGISLRGENATITDEPSEEVQLWQSAEELIEPGAKVPTMPPVIISTFGGNHGGAPTFYDPSSKYPPADCLAFYLPFHRYRPDWWGVYLLYEGIIWLAGELFQLAHRNISKIEAFHAARLALFYHEIFHHKTECFATRLELTHRQEFYVKGFESLYQSEMGTDRCLEEGLAEANALKGMKKRIRNQEIANVLASCIAGGPPGYRRGTEFSVGRSFNQTTHRFAEENQNVCLPTIPARKGDIWKASPHLFDGLANIKSHVNYVISRNSPIVARTPLRFRLSPNRLVKKLQELAGIVLVREGRRHQIWRSAQGNTFPIPRHPHDLGPGIMREIIRQAGLTMSLQEFLDK